MSEVKQKAEIEKMKSEIKERDSQIISLKRK